MDNRAEEKRAVKARTLVIFALAAALLIVSLLVGSRSRHSVTPPVPMPPPGDGSATVGGTLMMNARLSNRYVRAGDGTESVDLLVDLDAAKQDLAKSVPMDIAIVVDRSGSMLTDNKMERAKMAARQLVSKLRTGDRVALITYSTDVSTEAPLTAVTADSRQALNFAIDNLQAHGATNISGAMMRAQKVLGTDDRTHRVRRMILVSDGHPTAGWMESSELTRLAKEIRTAGVSITSIGLGLDYNELLMTGIAKEGGGHYFFVENAGQLARTFDKEFAALESTVARDTILTVSLAEGVEFEALYGYAYHQEGQRVSVPLSEFYAGENKSLLLTVRVRQRPKGLIKVAALDLNYNDLGANKVAIHRAALSMTTSTDPATVEAGVNRDVLLRRESLATANVYDKAMKEFESGNKAQAQKMIHDRSRRLKELSRTYAAPQLAAEADEATGVGGAMGGLTPSSAGGKVLLKKTRAKSYRARRRTLR